ncbi:hypothetical protein AMTR_s00151p00082340 [Amborella trichopoda]|uniref:Uncharacterized protein n=1 Tax=Amborella trichopoda TaxID=13333 RepID=W1NJ11_AMBTC|nr:hypothetical protein AMTR_s00151p00082340 [Amborella trichopoda]
MGAPLFLHKVHSVMNSLVLSQVMSLIGNLTSLGPGETKGSRTIASSAGSLFLMRPLKGRERSPWNMDFHLEDSRKTSGAYSAPAAICPYDCHDGAAMTEKGKKKSKEAPKDIEAKEVLRPTLRKSAQ